MKVVYTGQALQDLETILTYIAETIRRHTSRLKNGFTPL